MRRARKEGWKFAAKLVRGAYLVLERERAGRLGVASPIHETFEATESNFHRCISAVLREVAGRDAAVMVASHNYASVRHTLREMDALGISGADNAFAGVSFGQLLGMSDNLTVREKMQPRREGWEGWRTDGRNSTRWASTAWTRSSTCPTARSRRCCRTSSGGPRRTPSCSPTR